MKRTNDNIIQVKQFSDKHKLGGEEKGQPVTDNYVIEVNYIEVSGWGNKNKSKSRFRFK